MSLTGEVVKEWLRKWPDLPNKQLARMIYNADENKTLFSGIEHVRSMIRLYKGANGNYHRDSVKMRDFYKNFKTVEHEQV